MPRIPMHLLKPRSLNAIVQDISSGAKKVDAKLAEEAVASVAGNKTIEASEYKTLLGFTADLRPIGTKLPTDGAGWTQGTSAGQSLFTSLANHVRTTYEAANPSARAATNPFLWWAPQPTAAIEDTATLLTKLRADSSGWVQGTAERVIRDFPKATREVNTYTWAIKAPVQRKIDALVAKWKRGEISTAAEVEGPLRTYLQRSYR